MDGGTRMKTRLRADLRAAMKRGARREAALVRSLIAALDNAEAVPARPEQASLVRHDFGSGSADVERRRLSDQQVRDVLASEIEQRERAAAELDRLGEREQAALLRADVLSATRYLAG